MHGDPTRPSGDAPGGVSYTPGETPAALIQTFVERCNVSLATLAAELRLPGDVVEAYAHHGAPPWFRLALAGVAIQLGIPRGALTWLVHTPGDPPVGRADSNPSYEPSDVGGSGPSAGWALDGTMGA